MKLTHQMIIEAVDGIDSWCTVRMHDAAGYSGRGMDGARCVAVVFDSVGDMAAFGMSLAYVVGFSGRGGRFDEPGDLIDGTVRETRGYVDFLGASTVLYWPHIPPTEG